MVVFVTRCRWMCLEQRMGRGGRDWEVDLFVKRVLKIVYNIKSCCEFLGSPAPNSWRRSGGPAPPVYTPAPPGRPLLGAVYNNSAPVTNVTVWRAKTPDGGLSPSRQAAQAARELEQQQRTEEEELRRKMDEEPSTTGSTRPRGGSFGTKNKFKGIL